MLRVLALSLFTGSLFVSYYVAANTAVEPEPVVNHPIIVKLIDTMVKKHQFDKKSLQQLFHDVKRQPEIIEKMNRPAEGFPWHRYRNIFLKQKRIDQGVEFWNENEALLKKAEDKYGVPPSVIVGILGVETRYGMRTGGYRVIDALTTIVVDFPRRSKYFKKELVQLLLLSREEGFNTLELMGSYAGAMGKAQFMPSSYRHYAVDFSGDKVRDLLNNTADAVGSIASYLSQHKWQRGQPITSRASIIGGDKYKKFLKKGMKPKVLLSDIKNYQVEMAEDYPLKLKASLIELEQKEGMEYWLGLPNFYSITRYNHSNLYAMAVFQLGESIKAKRNR